MLIRVESAGEATPCIDDTFQKLSSIKAKVQTAALPITFSNVRFSFVEVCCETTAVYRNLPISHL